VVFLSRFPIPYPKRREKLRYFKQVSIYGFTPESLDQFSKFKRGPAELAEDIEVLRFIEIDITVRMVEVDQDTIAVDTPSDLEAVRKIISAMK
jgi:3-deoxy-manno-octulosonate cytidylyltransferase (CMP-KDO synthetase)